MAKKPKRGRPSTGDPKGKVIGVRVSEEESELIQAAADADSRPVSNWIRLTILQAAEKFATRT